MKYTREVLDREKHKPFSLYKAVSQKLILFFSQILMVVLKQLFHSHCDIIMYVV